MPPSLFPAISVNDARILADTIADKNAGQPMARLDVFGDIGKAPDSGASRSLVTASSSYKLTTGGYTAETLSLTTLGERLSVEGDDTALIDAVLSVDVFAKFFERYRDSKLPAGTPAKTYLATIGVPVGRTAACFDQIVENGKLTGLIAPISGSDHVRSREHALQKKEKKDGATGQKTKTDLQTSDGTSLTKVDTQKTFSLPSLNINVEIHLPADTRPEVYDAIFSSMRKHLLDAE